MTLEIIISTSNERIMQTANIIDTPIDNVRFLIIQQVFNGPRPEDFSEFISRYAGRTDVRFIQSETKGLALSRNIGLRNASADLILLADDDISYLDGFERTIFEAHTRNPETPIITFQFLKESMEPFKKYPGKERVHSTRTLMRVSSIEVSFKRRLLEDGTTLFDEHFGLGSRYPTSEENIFMLDNQRAGHKAKYIPRALCVHPEVTSGFRWDNRNLVEAKGASFDRMFPHISLILLTAFALKKYPDYRSLYSIPGFMSLLMKGRRRLRTNRKTSQ